MKNGVQFLLLAVISFFLFWVEAIVLLVENVFYHDNFFMTDMVPTVFHWMLTGVLWLLGAFFIWQYSAKKLSFNFFGYHKTPETKRFAIAGILTLLIVFIHFVQRSFCLKSIDELVDMVGRFGSAGIVAQILRLIFIAGAVSLMSLIVIFGQKAVEDWSKYKRLPWGGLLLALTYGILVMVIYGFLAGVIAMLESVIVGIIYIVLRKNIRFVYAFMIVAFIL